MPSPFQQAQVKNTTFAEAKPILIISGLMLVSIIIAFISKY